jgi:hypothetical protein
MPAEPPAEQPPVDEPRLVRAAREYLIATRAIHEVHGSTDVHGHGGFSGQAFTQHCAWECGATGVRYVNENGVLRRIVEPPPHGRTMAEWERAVVELIEALREANQD